MARILFVDDDPFTLETLKRSVQMFGHQAITASNGEEAYQQAVEKSPDMILTDMMLPDMDGLDLLKQLGDNPGTGQIPVVMLSASPELDMVEICRQAGAKEFLSKPVHLQTLQDVIQRFTAE